MEVFSAEPRYPKDVEPRYGMVELEALAIHYDIKQCPLYLSELPYFDVITERQPLKTIFNKKNQFAIDNDRMINIKQKLQRKYVFTVECRKGANPGVPDALNRSLVKDAEKEREKGLDCGNISAITKCLVVKNMHFAMIKLEPRSDDKYKTLHWAVLTGFD